MASIYCKHHFKQLFKLKGTYTFEEGPVASMDA
jgi:hypothetical protein